MKIYTLIATSLLIAGNAYAQDSLMEQINAVEAAQKQEEAAERAAQQAQERKIAQRKAEMLADKQRDQTHEDKLRELDVQERALQIEAEKARVARQNDFIDQELKERQAVTDVIKSHADVNRNLSEGTKTLLEKKGEAEVKKESGVFR